MTTVTYTIDGMTCGHCVASVTTEVSSLDGVTDVQVDLTTGTVAITSAAAISQEDVAAAVEEAGYVLIG